MTFQEARSFWKSAVATTRSVTWGEGAVGGHATRKARNLLDSSALYIADEISGKSIKLQYKGWLFSFSYRTARIEV